MSQTLPRFDDEHRKLAHEVVDLVFDHVARISTRKVVDFIPHDELRELARLDDSRAGDDFASLARLFMSHSNQLHHPAYIGHQVCPPFPQAAIADFLVSSLNQSTAVWEMSPFATVAEKEVIDWAKRKVGYPDGAAGTQVSGGSAANLTALLAARSRWRKDLANLGKRGVILCSSDAHYSVARAASIIGLAPDDVLKVSTDAEHRLDPADLEAKLEAIEMSGRSPIAIVATAGSTAAGSFDDLQTIAALRDRFRTWLHVDAAHGASIVLSERLRYRVAGIERSDSICWDPHKMLWMPLSLGFILVRNGQHLREAFEADAPYLFDPAKASINLGESTIQCSRRADAMKLWFALRTMGERPFAASIERVTEMTRLLFERVAAADDFEAMHRPHFNIFCFRWTGDGSAAKDALDRKNGAIREALIRSGRAWITSTLLKGTRVLRTTMMNLDTDEQVLDRLLDDIRTIANEI
jgi:L-2,4-diaminobutyrate decarboxylase